MKKQIFAILCALVLALTICLLQPVNAAEEYVTLTQATTMDIPEGQSVWVDLNGNDLTVTGSGTLYAIDTANDSYDEAACGSVTNNGTVQIAQDVQAANGNRYIALTNGAAVTMHRLDMRLTAVTLRTSEAGLYYKATYNCDTTLAANVGSYGVVLSVDNMPGADFLTETGDINRYTVAKDFQSGVVATSGSVFGIMKAEREAVLNDQYGKTKVYANPYIRFNIGTGLTCMGDTANGGKTVADQDFTGHAYSLQDVLAMLDGNYSGYDDAACERMDYFYIDWKKFGMNDWSFQKIAKNYTRDIRWVDGQGYCPVCDALVDWQALTDDSAKQTLSGDKHYYLTKDLTYKGEYNKSTPYFLVGPETKKKVACLHLNGCDITAENNHAIYGNHGILNVMGSGTVTGYTFDYRYGGAVTCNNTTTTSAVNLYSGTYRRTDNSAGDGTAHVLAIRNNGGELNLYKDVVVEATGVGNAICIGTTNSSSSDLGLYGATVNGNIFVRPKSDNGIEQKYKSNITIDSATITGTVTLDASQDKILLKGSPVIGLLTVPTGFMVTLDNLQEGTDVTVTAEGIFTKANENAADYARYFKTKLENKCVFARGDALCCDSSYAMNLQLDENNKAYCPVCGDTVTWEALTDDSVHQTLSGDKHYYLTKDLTYKGEYNKSTPYFLVGPETKKKVACLHLNGCDITAENNHAIYGGYGILNVMGSGTVTGYTFDYRYGGAVTCNNTTTTSAVNLYSGTYRRTDNSAGDGTAHVLAIRNNGGELNLYKDVVVEATGVGNAICIGTTNSSSSDLGLYGATVNGNIFVRPKSDNGIKQKYKSNITIDSATITGTVTLDASQDKILLKGSPVIGQLIVPSGFLVTLENIQTGADVTVAAEGIFAEANDQAQQWNEYFTAANETDWVVVQNKALAVTQRKTLANGKKVIFIGNSYTYYGKCVIEKAQNVFSQEDRSNDRGYFYQLCKANGVDVEVTNFTYGGHTLEDIYSGSCAADRGHDGHDHLADLTDRNYDYVILQNGTNSQDKPVALDEVRPLMDIFLEGNPNTKFVFLVQYKVHESNYVWRSTIKDLEEAGIIVVDWGAVVYDVMTGAVPVPGGMQTYSKYSFIVNKSASDGFHPNVLTGYITAQMLYSAITGEKAEGQDYSFWNDPNANAAFDMKAYKETYYAYDATAPSNTNFEAIFGSAADMTGLQQLIDRYLAEKGYRDYE